MGYLYKIDKFINHPDYQIIIATSQKSVKGLCLSELSLEISSDYASRHDTGAGEGRIAHLAKSTSKMLGKEQISLKNLGMTIADWQGTQPVAFNFEVLFISTQLGEDPRRPAITLLEMASPSRKAGGWMLQAPNGYSPDFKNWHSAKGTATIRVGRHFIASNMLISNVNYTSSRELTQDNWPLYVRCTFNARYFRIVTAEDIPNFFR